MVVVAGGAELLAQRTVAGVSRFDAERTYIGLSIAAVSILLWQYLRKITSGNFN